MGDLTKALDDKHEEFNSGNNAYDSVIGEITFIESFIPEFFSKNGEADTIKKMYSDIKTKKQSLFFESSLDVVDINKSSHIYEEYISGMESFIDDIKLIEETAALEAFEDKFKIAKEKDGMFIESLFGGSLNGATDTDIAEATSNVEFLIDFIPQLGRLKDKCNDIHSYTMERVSDNDKSALLNESADMLYESVRNYCYSTVRVILESYSDILNELYGEKTKQVNLGEFKLL